MFTDRARFSPLTLVMLQKVRENFGTFTEEIRRLHFAHNQTFEHHTAYFRHLQLDFKAKEKKLELLRNATLSKAD